MKILDGRKLADQILQHLKQEINSQKVPPHLAVIMVGDNPAGLKYVEMKQLAGQKIGVKTTIHHLPVNTDQDKVVELLAQLSHDQNVNGILVQLPLPTGIDTNTVVNTINPKKDVDGLTGLNLGKLFQGDETVPVSASPSAVIKLLEKHQITFKSAHVVIINNTALIGLPLTALFNNRQATVTLCHQYTRHLKHITKTADILISAVGIKSFITADMIKKGAIVVGLGVSQDNHGRLAGDLDFKALLPKVSYITPNFGGIGPMTIACLFQNLVKLIK